jgi:NADPH-dependent glutamate synthase beta subunit-like oxidoreductase/NAD(P)H-flavin reductase
MKLNLNGLKFQDLFTTAGLLKCDGAFLSWLRSRDPGLLEQLNAYRHHGWGEGVELSEFLIKSSQHLEAFIAQSFSIEKDVASLNEDVKSEQTVFLFKQYFVLKKARRLISKVDSLPPFADLDVKLKQALNLFCGSFSEMSLSRYGLSLLDDELLNQDSINVVVQWCTHQLVNPGLAFPSSSWVVFKIPAKADFQQLIPLHKIDDYTSEIQAEYQQSREGFALTDSRMSLRQVMNEVDHCVYCHEKEGDFCSTGFPEKKGKPELGYKSNALNELLVGCPLDEKISEMQLLKKQGFNIGALAVIMIDNPMCPATGHRICNDCMKACIYYKNEPVNIPEIETRVLTDVLSLPWGVEVYDLLTRWNPLRRDQYVMKPYNGAKVLVMGMGPAGFTLAHHLLMDGFAVVGADGLKLEPLDDQWVKLPVRDFQSIEEQLDERIVTGFGGVSEYGITVRWDKNFLKLILMSLLRKQCFQVVGSIRFGGTLTVEDAWSFGFDHLAVAVGAGLPRELMIENSLAVGMRQANDFLMALQLTGAQKKNSLANLQIRMPIVVVGGGLTGVDAATEAQAYYLLQIEKIEKRYAALSAAYGESKLRSCFTKLDLIILDEYISHARELYQLKSEASKANIPFNVIPLVRRWGGVKIVYRRSIQESPAYRLNHEELAKALEQGLYYCEQHAPTKALLDEFAHVKALECEVKTAGGMINQTLAARTILVATGAKPNVAYEFEHKGTFTRSGFQYQRFNKVEEQLKLQEDSQHVKSSLTGPFTSYQNEDKLVSFLGDTHPVFHGSVVKAVASAKKTYPEIVRSIKLKEEAGSLTEYREFRAHIDDFFRSRVVSCQRVTPDVYELKVYCPQASRQFFPGQIYRIQNYESFAQVSNDTLLHMEAIPVIGISRPEEPHLLSFLIKESGVSSQLVGQFKKGDKLSLMGPSGAKMSLPHDGVFIIAGGEMARMQILSVGYELKARGVSLVFFSLTDSQLCDLEIAQLCDQVIRVAGSRSLELALQDWGKADNRKVTQLHLFAEVDEVKKIQAARSQGRLQRYQSTRFTAAVFGPMQCMLKGVCAQCLQWQIDPQTGKRTKAVYACSWQNQPLEIIDLENINERLKQNSCQETLSKIWLSHVLDSNKSVIC